MLTCLSLAKYFVTFGLNINIATIEEITPNNPLIKNMGRAPIISMVNVAINIPIIDVALAIAE